ncbi:MAG: NAD-dependent epimerase/dehydratase family protein [Dehalococcoidia bacterium]
MIQNGIDRRRQARWGKAALSPQAPRWADEHERDERQSTRRGDRGGAGISIGDHLTDALLARGDTNVIVLDNLYRGRWANVARYDGDPQFTFVHGDVRNQAHVDAHGVDVVYHLAAQSNVMGAVSDPRYSFDTNVAGTFNVLSAARDNGVCRVVFASSARLTRSPRHCPSRRPRSRSRTPAGRARSPPRSTATPSRTSSRLETAVLRFSNVYGPRDHGRVIPLWIERSLKGEPLEVYGGGQVIDFVWVGVAVEALLRRGRAAGRFPVNVAGGVATPIANSPRAS